jgi:Tfp pilus assembly protein PilF
MRFAFKRITRCIRPSMAAFFCLALVSLCFESTEAQSGRGVDETGTGGRHVIQGRIYFPSGRPTDVRVKVKLLSYNSGELSVFSDLNGNFRFTSLTPGSYTVVVDAGDEYDAARENVYIETEATNSRTGITLPLVTRPYRVEISLRPKASDATKPGVVNAALAGVPSGARDLYQKALESARTGNHKKAVEELQNAIAIYPNFPLALNELGVQYLKLKQPDKAVLSFAAALKLSPDEFLPRLNYGIALAEQKSFGEAEVQLRQALKKNDSSPAGHLYLGITLISLHNYLEAEKELLRSITLGGESMGLAHYYLGGIYWQKKQNQAAADQLELYLQLAPNSPDADRTRATIKELRKQQ